MAESPDEVTSKLAAKVAHELNNPLDAVLRFVSLAQRKAQAGQYGDLERHLTDAKFGLQRMTEILRDLMEVGRMAHDAATARAHSLAQLLAEAVRQIAPQAEQKRVTLDVGNELAAETTPRFDVRLSQVLANLLKNAVEASPEGGKVTIRISSAGFGRIALTVEDTGAGIDAGLMPRLFTPYLTTKAAEGHGLGLAISREMMAALGGTLALENGVGGGCRARAELPLPRM
jgi:signal transduction histidine kinase